MAAKLLVISCLVAAAHSLAVPVALHAHEEEHYAPAHYEFQYSVHDTHTGDIKQQQESRQGDVVHGSYSLIEADGRRRIVEYTADKEHGFNAVVRHEGEAQTAKIAYAAAPVAKLAYAAPVAKIAYAPAPVAYAAPVAKVAYAAPVAKIAYAAPIAKLAYAAPVAKVAYAAPVAKLAYAAPVAKVAYAAPASHFTYSSPIISYHH